MISLNPTRTRPVGENEIALVFDPFDDDLTRQAIAEINEADEKFTAEDLPHGFPQKEAIDLDDIRPQCEALRN